MDCHRRGEGRKRPKEGKDIWSQDRTEPSPLKLEELSSCKKCYHNLPCLLLQHCKVRAD